MESDSRPPPQQQQEFRKRILNANDSAIMESIICSKMMILANPNGDQNNQHQNYTENQNTMNFFIDQIAQHFSNNQSLTPGLIIDPDGNEKIKTTSVHNGASACVTAWDGFYCWPQTDPGTILMRSCKDVFNSVGELPKPNNIDDDQSYRNAFAYRICDHNGSWINDWTNYTECLLLIDNNESDEDGMQHQMIRQLVIIIMFICSILSLILLAISLFILTYFHSLRCCRLRVHRNLTMALIIHSFLLLLLATPHLFYPDESLSSYWEIEWLCKSILTLKLYSTLASINWMFVEGFQLHRRVAVSVFHKDAPFKVYHLLGWGIPLVLVSIWAVQMSLTMDTVCWSGYAHSIYIWIIVGPMILALSLNCIFLVNIIRVLLTKLRLTTTIEIEQIRKAIKATALLFPLLGISHLLFCINPDDDGRLEDAYLIFNAFLQSSQGIFVSILYCFMDSDVQQVLKLTYQRAKSKQRWHPGTGGGQRRPTATGSFHQRIPSPNNRDIRIHSLDDGGGTGTGIQLAKTLSDGSSKNGGFCLRVLTDDEDNQNDSSLSTIRSAVLCQSAASRNGSGPPKTRSWDFSFDATNISGHTTINNQHLQTERHHHQGSLRSTNRTTITGNNSTNINATISANKTRSTCIMYNDQGEMVRFNPGTGSKSLQQQTATNNCVQNNNNGGHNKTNSKRNANTTTATNNKK